MKYLLVLLLSCLIFTNTASADERSDIVTTLDNFYIGDKTGDITYKAKSLHPTGAYRYVNKNGDFVQHTFVIKQGGADNSYNHELLSIDIFGQVASAKLRLENKETGKVEYKVMLLNKINTQWRITTISWGFEMIQ
jgi:hypothetical protein